MLLLTKLFVDFEIFFLKIQILLSLSQGDFNIFLALSLEWVLMVCMLS